MSRRARQLLVVFAALVALPALAYIAGPVHRVDPLVAAPALPDTSAGPGALDACTMRRRIPVGFCVA